MPDFTRRHIVRTGLATAALGAFGVPLLQGCSNEGRGGTSGAGRSGVTLPDYIPYEGFTPDLRGENGVDDASLAYPGKPVKATDGPPGDGAPITVFALTNTPIPPERGNNSFWQALEQRLGFTLNLQLVPANASDYEQRFQTAVAGNQLPDIFTILTGLVPSLPAMLNEQAADLTPHLSGDAVAKYPFLANIPTASWQSTVYDGKIFAIPIPRGAQSSMTFFARSDVLDRVGITDPPSSLQEFHDVCAEITASQANTWALARVPLGYLRQMFEIPNEWSVVDGSLVRSYEHEQQKDALEAGRKLVADGLVHPDGFGAPSAERKTWMVNGTSPLVDDTFSAWPDFYNFPIPDGFRLTTWAPPLADGSGAADIWLAGPSHNITSISVDAEDRVEALLDFLNYLAAPFGTEEYLFKIYGIEGEHHTLQGTDPVLTDKGRSETQLSLKYIAEGPWMTYQAGYPDVVQAQFDAHSALVPTAIANPVEGLYSETSTRRARQIGLEDLENDILQGREPVSAWDDGVAEWKQAGGDDIRDEFQQAMEERDNN